MKDTPYFFWGRLAFIFLLIFVTVLAYPSGEAMGEDGDVDEDRGLDPLLFPTQDDNHEATRGILWTGILMVLVVIIGTLAVLRADQHPRSHINT